MSLDIAIEYADTLYDSALDVVEESYNFNYELMGYSPIGEDVFFNTTFKAVEYLVQNDKVFEKCRDLLLTTLVVPVYNQDGELLYYLPYDEAVKLK